MSFDFDTGSNQQSDPTADFLARERAAAGALEGDADLFGGSHLGTNSMSATAQSQQRAGSGDRDFETSASAFPALDGDDDGFSAPPSGRGAAAAPTGFMDDGEDDLLGGGAPTTRAPADERVQFERTFPELDEPEELMPAPASVSSLLVRRHIVKILSVDYSTERKWLHGAACWLQHVPSSTSVGTLWRLGRSLWARWRGRA